MTRRNWALAGAATLVAATCGVVATRGQQRTEAVARTPAPTTVDVERGRLSATVSHTGILTYRAGPDGSPYTVMNRAEGVYTQLPEAGDEVSCGDVLYRVDEEPVVLLCGTVPAFRTLDVGLTGRDVRQLNRNLHRLGYDSRAKVRIDPGDRHFTPTTAKALAVLQRSKGADVTGRLASDDAVFTPEAVRVGEVTGQVGGPARRGTPVLTTTSGSLHVRVNLDPSQQGEVRKGDQARITLPGNTPATGRVDGFGRIARTPEEPGSRPSDATVPTFIRLDDPAGARGLDEAPVQVDITTRGVDDALSVPVTALVGHTGGGYAVEVVRAGGRRELVPVVLGLFDSGSGRVQVEGRLDESDVVVVPSI